MSPGTMNSDPSQFIDVDVDLEGISATQLTYTPSVIKTRSPKIGVKLWIVENNQCCMDYIKTKLTVLYFVVKLI